MRLVKMLKTVGGFKTGAAYALANRKALPLLNSGAAAPLTEEAEVVCTPLPADKPAEKPKPAAKSEDSK